jgi:hypothetical protein
MTLARLTLLNGLSASTDHRNQTGQGTLVRRDANRQASATRTITRKRLAKPIKMLVVVVILLVIAPPLSLRVPLPAR